MASAMTTTMLVAAIGTVVIAAEIKPTRNIVPFANAGTAQKRNRKIAPAKKANAIHRTTRKTKTATMTTTTANAIGMEATAVPSRTVAQSTPSIARHANVWTRKTKAIITAKACANSRTTKGMAIATTRTTTVGASGTAEIAVRKPSRAVTS